MNLISYLLYSWIWNYFTTKSYSISQEMFKEFNKSICGRQCERIYCPFNTVMKIQLVELSFGAKNEPKCMSLDSSNESLGDLEDPDNCKIRLEIHWRQFIHSECSNKTQCNVCETTETKTERKGCHQITNIVVTYLCIPNDVVEENITENSYYELTCEHLISHRIIIYKASLILDKNIPSIVKHVSNRAKQKDCSQVDVSANISETCSFKRRCQAGPNQLSSGDCGKRQLLLQYACVHESVIKKERQRNRPIFIHLTNPTKLQNNDIPILSSTEISIHLKKHKSEEIIVDKLIWIITGASVLVVLVMVFAAICWSFGMRKCRTRQTSLFHKIKDANFCPPPTPINKIQIDLPSRESIFPDHSKDYNTLLHNEVIHQLQCSQINCEHYANTICTNKVFIHSNPITNSSNSSNAAGSSGQISSPQSDSSKGNMSSIFNYLTSDRHLPIQTYI